MLRHLLVSPFPHQSLSLVANVLTHGFVPPFCRLLPHTLDYQQIEHLSNFPKVPKYNDKQIIILTMELVTYHFATEFNRTQYMNQWFFSSILYFLPDGQVQKRTWYYYYSYTMCVDELSRWVPPMMIFDCNLSKVVQDLVRYLPVFLAFWDYFVPSSSVEDSSYLQD